MSAQIDTLSITVPGHVVRKNTEGSDTVLILTGEQARYVFESLSEVAAFFMPPSRIENNFVAKEGTVEPAAQPPKLTAIKASE